MRPIPLIAVLLAGLAVPAWADIDNGCATFDRGDYATALQESAPLAEQGHAEAQKLARTWLAQH